MYATTESKPISIGSSRHDLDGGRFHQQWLHLDFILRIVKILPGRRSGIADWIDRGPGAGARLDLKKVIRGRSICCEPAYGLSFTTQTLRRPASPGSGNSRSARTLCCRAAWAITQSRISCAPLPVRGSASVRNAASRRPRRRGSGRCRRGRNPRRSIQVVSPIEWLRRRCRHGDPQRFGISCRWPAEQPAPGETAPDARHRFLEVVHQDRHDRQTEIDADAPERNAGPWSSRSRCDSAGSKSLSSAAPADAARTRHGP